MKKRKLLQKAVSGSKNLRFNGSRKKPLHYNDSIIA